MQNAKISTICLLGTSNLRHIVLQLQECLQKYNIRIINLIFEASGSEHCLFELVKNYNEISRADLIIYDTYSEDIVLNKNVDFVCKTIERTFEILSSFGIPTVHLMLPINNANNLSKDQKMITNTYLSLINYHKFNIAYIGKKNKEKRIYSELLKDRIHFYDCILIDSILQLIDNIHLLSKPVNSYTNIIDNFIILQSEKFCKEQYVFKYTGRDFNYIQIKKKDVIKIPDEYVDMYIHSYFSFNKSLGACLRFENSNAKLQSLIRPAHQFKQLGDLFLITKDTFLSYSENYTDNIDCVEPIYIKQTKHLGFINLGDILLVKDKNKFYCTKININTDQTIIVDNDLDCSKLVINVDFCKELVDNYIAVQWPIKSIPYKQEVSNLQNENNSNKKKYTIILDRYIEYRLKSHLSYRFGNVLLNSNLISLSFNLLYEYKLYKNNKNLIDCREYKNYEVYYIITGSIEYKLGQAFIAISKNWYKSYGLAYVKFVFIDLIVLRRKFNFRGK
ncbi:hypothetical protein [Campylobacter jejuni]|uniref:Uncharacterized protein n=1 Tax=Campylobacter jejuni TaxID=197 RepID=A0A431BWQ5_CAMJU|nr:hypothetical protein [Campylobacter jejuni]RTJ45684.1 hypothetical protein C3H68_06990 [Campylobacter jejuni]RTJ78671.1 hypothetical protein C3H57_07670 [Campylobacter jejuni]